MIKKLAKRYKVASPQELLEIALDLGVKLYPCQMTMELYGIRKDDFIDGLQQPMGAASFLEKAVESKISMFI